MKFLIDECLSPDLVEIARNQGFGLSTHVNWLGLQSAEDWTIVRHAVDKDYVIVTNNTTDFITLVGRENIHAGLVCLNATPSLMDLEVQKILFKAALDELAGDEPVNDVLDITLTTALETIFNRYVWHADH